MKRLLLFLFLSASVFGQIKLSQLPLVDALKPTDRFLVTQYLDSLDVITGDSVFQSRVATWNWFQTWIGQNVEFLEGDTLAGRITLSELKIQRNIDSIYQHLLKITKHEDTLISHKTTLLQNATDISLNANSITSIGGDVSTNTGNIVVNADGVSTNASSIITTNGVVSTNTGAINVNSGNIDLRVKKDSIISFINLSPELVDIEGDNIQLTGNTTVDGTFTLNGSAIVNGSVTAGKMSVTDLSSITANIGSITSGTLTSANWSTTLGSRFDLSNGTLKLGGSGTNGVSLVSTSAYGQLVVSNGVNSTFVGYNGALSGIMNSSGDYWYTDGTFRFGGAGGISYNGSIISLGSNVSLSGTLSSLSADLGTITAGSIDIGAGAFTVSAAGALTATSASITGAINSGSTITGATITGATISGGSVRIGPEVYGEYPIVLNSNGGAFFGYDALIISSSGSLYSDSFLSTNDYVNSPTYKLSGTDLAFSTSPGNSKYYGTNGSGTVGYYDLPTHTSSTLNPTGSPGYGSTHWNTETSTGWIYTMGGWIQMN